MLQITLPGLGPAYTPPCLGQDNPGSSARYMPLIIKKVRWGCRKREEEGRGREEDLGEDGKRVEERICIGCISVVYVLQ